jgi:ubiquinone/menaquinone biosynthesis C-methylase UbiE
METLAHPGPRGLHDETTAGALVRQRYDRVAGIYEQLRGLDLLITQRWRRALWSKVDGGDVLEVGIGAGINFDLYPSPAKVVGIDIAPKMLDAARRRGARMGLHAQLEIGDVQALRFEAASFDSAVATFVFCSVPDPVRGLDELRRVLRPGGRLLLLEHVVSGHAWLAAIMRALDPLMVRLSGAHIARDTVANVRRAGFVEINARGLFSDVVQLIEARAPARTA